MHKATFLQGTLRLTIRPDGPILIKAGETGGGDPTLPDMQFVRTKYAVSDGSGSPYAAGAIYLPGPSLKGVIRAHCERICRTLDGEKLQKERRERRQKFDDDDKIPEEARHIPLADNPLGDGTRYKGLDDMRYNSGRAVEALRDKLKSTAAVYRLSSFVAQLFGSTALAGRVRFADAYGKHVVTEERNGVAIDRVYGSVAVGPFNYETVVSGEFPTRIDFKNVTLAQLGLLGLALRDLAEGRVALGFGKSRGLGRVTASFESLDILYPTCVLEGNALRLIGSNVRLPAGHLGGVGAFGGDAYRAYDFPQEDTAPLPDGLRFQAEETMGVRLRAEGADQVKAIWKACMPAWKREIGL
ncbi:MAG: RAMP superfamily CRISPR-associated protein [Roseiflexus sp.]|nr:RAMP superfamily CRISPR-associated protein [Roseiflexus sp.]MDW8145160.1 RAMP superfamily CRISPR-associated protein [Roseiflexaceae bacterium]MDW8234351.1 RAMP superfamily CRISPR-associated protein [Roseiflexaceae bacterium]